MTQHNKPCLRERRERKLYSDDWALGDEEIEGYHTFDLDEKIHSNRFNGDFVKDMSDVDFDLSNFQKNGFNWPLLFKTKEKLGMVMPGEDFSINDVRMAVGSRRMLDVMDVNTQKNVEMTMKDWQRYFESKDKDKLLNVISLEFSHTKLENLVQVPTVVRQVDWVEKVWPRHLKEAQTEATNVLEDMMYPKVQKYCLMSVGGCYTDFHIDFGGTSVWYHVLKGRKVFWLIPPTESNLQLYEQWVLSGKQGDVFFGDNVDKCERIELFKGNTFFIPTGWIHAVYTPEDSMVFGGNFLHSYGIEKQLRVAQVEDTTHVPQKFRYPFFTEMLWYVLERYVHVLLGRTHLSLPPSEHEKLLAAIKGGYTGENNNMTSPSGTGCEDSDRKHTHLTRYELHGLKAIVMYLHSLPNSRKNVPDLVADPVPLIQDVKTLVEEHRFDRPELAMTSKPVLEWWEREPVRFGVKRSSSEGYGGVKKPRGEPAAPRLLPPNLTKIRYRRTRCRVCEACVRPDCRKCSFCLDMTRYGGSGVLKQRCKFKKCPQPLLPEKAVCFVCNLDGHMQGLFTKKCKDESPSTLMECSICFKVCHPDCIDYPSVEGVVTEDYPNSWKCPECISEGYDKEYKNSRGTGRLSAISSDSGAGGGVPKLECGAVNESPTVRDSSSLLCDPHSDTHSSSLLNSSPIKTENSSHVGADDCSDNEDPLTADNKGMTVTGLLRQGQGYSGSDPQEQQQSCLVSKTMVAVGAQAKTQEDGHAVPPPMPTWEQLQARTTKRLVAPQWVVRPAPIEVSRADAGLDEGEGIAKRRKPANMCGLVILGIFKYLSVHDLLSVMRVCREWARWSIHPTLWPHITLPPNQIVRPDQLEGIVRRQPSKLTLNFVPITQEQLAWLLTRLPQLSEFEFEGNSWGEARVLATCYCPPLVKLNLNFVQGISDSTMTLLLSSPVSRRPGFRNQQSSRIKNVTHLSLSNAIITDGCIKALCTELHLVHLDISCGVATEETIAIIAENTGNSLESLDIRGCVGIGPFALPELAKLKSLSRLGIGECPIPAGALKAWSQTYGYSESENKGVLTRIPPSVRQVNMAIQSRLVKTAFQEILKNHLQKVSQHASLSHASIISLEKGADIVDDKKSVGESKPSSSRSSLVISEEKIQESKETEVSKKKPVSSTEKENLSVDEVLSLTSSKKFKAVTKDSSLNKKKVKPKENCDIPDDGQAEIINVKQKSSGKAGPGKTSSGPSDNSPTRSRRRPSRFTDLDVEDNSPMKNQRKKMKQVTVELEDIGASSSYNSEKTIDKIKTDLKKTSETPRKRALIGPKSRCGFKIEETLTDTKCETSESDVSLASVGTVDDNQHSPRRMQRRCKDVTDDIKDIKDQVLAPIVIKKSRLVTVADTKLPQIKKIKEDVKKLVKNTGDAHVKRTPKKEKDIMTRSKRLKEDPLRDLSSGLVATTEMKSPHVMICRKDLETASSKQKIKSTAVKSISKIKLQLHSEDRVLKRHRSSPSSDASPCPSPLKKPSKEVNESETIYSSKLRKKQCDPVSFIDIGIKEPVVFDQSKKKDNQESARSRRRSIREDDEKLTSGAVDKKNTDPILIQKESESGRLVPAHRQSRRRNEDAEGSGKDKVDDSRTETKQKKVAISKSESRKSAIPCTSPKDTENVFKEMKRPSTETCTDLETTNAQKLKSKDVINYNVGISSSSSQEINLIREESKNAAFLKVLGDKAHQKKKELDNILDKKQKSSLIKQKVSPGKNIGSNKAKVLKSKPKHVENIPSKKKSTSETVDSYINKEKIKDDVAKKATTHAKLDEFATKKAAMCTKSKDVKEKSVKVTSDSTKSVNTVCPKNEPEKPDLSQVRESLETADIADPDSVPSIITDKDFELSLHVDAKDKEQSSCGNKTSITSLLQDSVTKQLYDSGSKIGEGNSSIGFSKPCVEKSDKSQAIRGGRDHAGSSKSKSTEGAVIKGDYGWKGSVELSTKKSGFGNEHKKSKEPKGEKDSSAKNNRQQEAITKNVKPVNFKDDTKTVKVMNETKCEKDYREQKSENTTDVKKQENRLCAETAGKPVACSPTLLQEAASALHEEYTGKKFEGQQDESIKMRIGHSPGNIMDKKTDLISDSARNRAKNSDKKLLKDKDVEGDFVETISKDSQLSKEKSGSQDCSGQLQLISGHVSNKTGTSGSCSSLRVQLTGGGSNAGKSSSSASDELLMSRCSTGSGVSSTVTTSGRSGKGTSVPKNGEDDDIVTKNEKSDFAMIDKKKIDCESKKCESFSKKHSDKCSISGSTGRDTTVKDRKSDDKRQCGLDKADNSDNLSVIKKKENIIRAEKKDDKEMGKLS